MPPASDPPSTSLAYDSTTQPAPPSSLAHALSQFSSLNLYKHEPLDHSEPSIRLITVSPILSPDGLIQCSMHHATTTDALYTCLSYTWGKPEPRQLILMNNKRFYVQPNLYEFIKVVRADVTRTPYQYWIDALCIEQCNMAERNHQVAQMGEIYSKAEVVVAWLGLASKHTLNHYADRSLVTLNRYIREAIYNDLAGNEYWNRAWIIQEFALARRLSVSISALTFTFNDIMSIIIETALRLPHGRAFYAFSSGNLLEKAEIISQPLWELLSTFNERKCSVARDRIFSLLGLCRKENRIEVDYECSVLQLIHSLMASETYVLCLCPTLIYMQSLRFEITELDVKAFEYQIGPYLECDVDPKVHGSEWLNFRGRWSDECQILRSIICQTIIPANYRSFEDVIADVSVHDRHDGVSFSYLHGGVVRLRMSLWYLRYIHRSNTTSANGGQSLWWPCTSTRPKTYNSAINSMRVGYGNWDINFPTTVGRRS